MLSQTRCSSTEGWTTKGYRHRKIPVGRATLAAARALLMLAAGHRIEDISRWLGHANILTTTRYLRVVDERHPGAKRLPW